MQFSVRCRPGNGCRRQPWLRGQGRQPGIEIRNQSAILIPKIVVDIPGNGLSGLYREQKRVRLEAVEIFGLIGAVDQPVLHGQFVVHVVRAPESHVIERQEVEVKRS